MRHHSIVNLACRSVLLLGILCSSWVLADTPLPNMSSAHTVGTVNCASSTCHGAITPWEDTPVLQNEYTTWLRLDKHARAYNVLLNEKSRKIAKNLALKQPANEAKICLDCHAHNPAPALRGERYVVAEGVGCEACHGPAEKWITSHTVPGTTHEDNVKNGLYPTNRPVAQAKLCLSCHFGDENRFVTHRIMGAGHPRISFELETFSALASRQLIETLADPKRGHDGLFPELVLFDCNSCHHPMSEQKYSPRLGVGPGRMHLNDSNLLMLRAIVSVVDPVNANAFNAQVAELHRAIAGTANAGAGTSATEDPILLAKKLSGTITNYIDMFDTRHFDAGVLRSVLKALISEPNVGNYTDYAGAEQLYLSVSGLASSLSKQGGLKSIPEINRSLTRLRNVLANEEKYNAAAFSTELAGFRSLISSQAK